MRSTLLLDDEVFRRAKQRAAELGTTLSDLVNQALRQALAASPKPAADYRMLTYGARRGTVHHEPKDFAEALDDGHAGVTNARLYASPTPLATALAAMDQLAAHPNCRLIAPGPDHWRRVAALCRATQATAKLVADAQHAAVAMAEGCTWVTRDPDFARFAPHGLSWQHLVLG